MYRYPGTKSFHEYVIRIIHLCAQNPLHAPLTPSHSHVRGGEQKLITLSAHCANLKNAIFHACIFRGIWKSPLSIRTSSYLTCTYMKFSRISLSCLLAGRWRACALYLSRPRYLDRALASAITFMPAFIKHKITPVLFSGRPYVRTYIVSYTSVVDV